MSDTFKEIFAEARKSFDYLFDRVILRFTKRISALMKEQLITQRDLAQKIGCSAPYVSKVFSGSPNLTLASMVKIADAVGCDIDVVVYPKSIHQITTKVTTEVATISQPMPIEIEEMEFTKRSTVVSETIPKIGKRNETDPTELAVNDELALAA
jgi:transcriptional regulator with XRE-family HTH domain